MMRLINFELIILFLDIVLLAGAISVFLNFPGLFSPPGRGSLL